MEGTNGAALANGGASATPSTTDAGVVSHAATAPAVSAMASLAHTTAAAVSTQPSTGQPVPQQPSVMDATATEQTVPGDMLGGMGGESFTGADAAATAAGHPVHVTGTDTGSEAEEAAARTELRASQARARRAARLKATLTSPLVMIHHDALGHNHADAVARPQPSHAENRSME